MFNEIEAKLAAVYDKFSGPVWDTIFTVYEIHDFPRFIRGDLIAQYDIEYVSHREISSSELGLGINHKLKLNPFALAQVLHQTLPGVDDDGYPNIIAGDGDAMEIIFAANGLTELNFGVARASFAPVAVPSLASGALRSTKTVCLNILAISKKNKGRLNDFSDAP